MDGVENISYVYVFLSTRQSPDCVQYGYACSELVHIKMTAIAMNLTPLNY